MGVNGIPKWDGYNISVPSSAVCVSSSTDGGGGGEYILRKSEEVEDLMGASGPATEVGCLMRNKDKAW